MQSSVGGEAEGGGSSAHTTPGGSGGGVRTPMQYKKLTPRVEEMTLSASKIQQAISPLTLSMISEDGAEGGGDEVDGAAKGTKTSAATASVALPPVSRSAGFVPRREISDEEQEMLEQDQLKSTLHRGGGGAKLLSWESDSPIGGAQVNARAVQEL